MIDAPLPDVHLEGPKWVGEDTTIGERTIVHIGAMIEPRAHVGPHCTIGPEAFIGEDAIVAAGEVVEDDVSDDGVWMGGRLFGILDGKTGE